jgi:uncharacterized protein (DUF1778 family)
MAKTPKPAPAKKGRAPSPLMVRLDEESKALLFQAAKLRRISVSDYVRTITVAQARREVLVAGQQTLALTPEEQLAFWNALDRTPDLTPAQQRLGSVMRGES